jgi:hypothetical protein
MTESNNTEDIPIPDGKGGWTTTKATPSKGQTQDPEKVQEAMSQAQEKDFYERVGALTEHINKVVKRYGKDYNLNAAEIAAAVFLENCNIRETYPDGQKEHDAICEGVAAWYQRNKNS